jgi:UDP-N-acetylglucosamine transferase subunit ALG13
MSMVLALVGTDHHPFDRMIDWLDEAAVRNPDVRFVVQYGASRVPTVALGHDYLPYDQLVRLVDEADVVVCHGGPGTIMDARAAGHLPICVPRDPALGEHVDGHQQRFAAMMDEVGSVSTCTTVVAFQVALAERLLVDRSRRHQGVGDSTLLARQRMTVALDKLVGATETRRSRKGFLRRLLGR